MREKLSEPSNFHNVERKSRPIKDDPNFAHVFPMFTFTCWKRPLCVGVPNTPTENKCVQIGMGPLFYVTEAPTKYIP